jgi:CheY-like chemotaxis protein
VLRDGQEALDFIFCRGLYAGRKIENCPKVILLDLKLPKVDGLEVLRILKGGPYPVDSGGHVDFIPGTRRSDEEL